MNNKPLSSMLQTSRCYGKQELYWSGLIYVLYLIAHSIATLATMSRGFNNWQRCLADSTIGSAVSRIHGAH